MASSINETDTRVTTRLWVDGESFMENGEILEYEGTEVSLDVERSDVNEVAIHLMIDGAGSKCSYYFDREEAADLAAALLKARALR